MFPVLPTFISEPDHQASSATCFSRSKAHPQIPQMTQIPKCRWPSRSNLLPSAPHGPTGFQGGGSLAPLVRKRRRPENPHDEVARPRPSRGGPCSLPRANFIPPLSTLFNLCNRWNLWIHGPLRVSVPSDSRLRFVGNQVSEIAGAFRLIPFIPGPMRLFAPCTYPSSLRREIA